MTDESGDGAVGDRVPLCFVVMPFGVKSDGQGGSVNFDAVYEHLLAPAIRSAHLEPLRPEQEGVGWVPHKPMFERLILAECAVADLTTANANVFYGLGVRHAARPNSTVLVSSSITRVDFDLAPDRVLPYALDSCGRPANAEEDSAAVVRALCAARAATNDSAAVRLIDDRPTPQIDRLKTDVFREEAVYCAELKGRLANARAYGADALRALARDLTSLDNLEAGVLVDLLLSYRAVDAWDEMISLAEAMPEPVRRTVLIREQYGFALNRVGRHDDAERVLLDVIKEHGPSSETYGLLGRVYKDRWGAERESSARSALGYLDRAIDAYRRGFEADWRDAYPGVNAVTLMEIREPAGADQQELLPVVRYANRRRIETGRADYWDHATRLELGVIDRNQEEATAGAEAALHAVRELWEPKSTAYNLSLIGGSRAAHGEAITWADKIEQELLKHAGTS